MKKKTKFKMEEKVFIVGCDGGCVVSGIGVMDFISGGKLTLYQIVGAHSAFVPEHSLISLKEARSGSPAGEST
jgi:hypothetical protein